MNQLKISTRLGILIGVLSALLLAIGALGLFGINRSNNSLKTVYEDRVVALDQLGEVSYLLQRNRVLVMDMLVQPEPANLEKRNKELRGNIQKVNATWDAYMATYLTPDEARLAQEFVQARTPYVQQGLVPAADALLAGQAEVALGIYKDRISPLAPATLAALDKLNHLQLDVAKQEFETAENRFHQALIASILSIASGLVFALAFGYALVRGIGRQLGGEPGDAASVAQSVAEGDLSTPIPIRPGDTGSLMVQLKAMQTSLAGVVSTVRQGSEAVAAASAQIAQGNQDLSARTEQQASALEQTAASMEELASAVQQNADSSRRADQLASSACRVAARGGDVVAQVVDTMTGINDASRKISDIISVIDGIAFQTNILALNAAVEAARAGEQGRGFAVVASEVRTLAGRSADAAKEIKTLIHASVERVEQGTVLVAQAGSTMTEVVTSIQRVNDMMGEISAASTEQSMGVAQIGEAVNQMDQATQQNAALVEEMAAAADSLRSQAQALVNTVAVFKVDGSEPRTGTRPLALRSTHAASPALLPLRRKLAALH
jgi:methyl-accepting chemotaxis protein-1 (serine sensor receptor)